MITLGQALDLRGTWLTVRTSCANRQFEPAKRKSALGWVEGIEKRYGAA